MNPDGNYTPTTLSDRLKTIPPRMWIIGGCVVALLLICTCGFGVFGTFADNSTTGKTKEAALTAAYSNAANTLSSCLTRTHQVANVAAANATAFDQVIKDSIAGTGPGGQFNLSTPTGQAGFFPLLVKAYPDLAGQTAIFNRVVDTINGCQTDFRDYQGAVLDLTRDFAAWKGNFWNNLLGAGSFPDNDLTIAIPGVPALTGAAAFQKMRQPIITTDTSDAYKNGTYQPADPFATPTAPTEKATPR